MAFHEVSFPEDIAYGSAGGPVRRTDIIVLDSGFEERNTSWASSRHKYNVSYGVKTYDLLHTLKEFWEARKGPLFGFRFKDFSDFRSVGPQTAISDTDQVIGLGDDSNTTFQLIKTYNSGGFTSLRTINKPISGTTIISLDDVPQGSGFTIDTTTGIVTFDVAPSNFSIIKAGYEFEVPVRFAADEITINLAAFEHGNIDDILLLELRI